MDVCHHPFRFRGLGSLAWELWAGAGIFDLRPLARDLVQGDLLQVGAFEKVCDGLARRVLVNLWLGGAHGYSRV